ncbi:hypothetical protein GCM10007890_05160 [Methylobacterium tardum]|uniref:Uncharacterized protein n=1 Tax=Methylobacterium tardum TaxID=374432 RepID=A0AA37T7N4_9HYPH|nr:hypothetical protein GCM10007890_05160 [Methylobacterium tardum]
MRGGTPQKTSAPYIAITQDKTEPINRPVLRYLWSDAVKNRIIIAVTALMLGAAPLSSALAANEGRWTGFAPYTPETTGALGLGVQDAPFYEGCPMSSAAEGNANQQTRPIKQYGQTAGGYRC